MEARYYEGYTAFDIISFINKNGIKKENILAITFDQNINRYHLFYWYEPLKYLKR